MAGRSARPRKVPERQCVGCGARRAKRELIRIARAPDGSIDIDLTGKRPGRGAYICPDPGCLDMALKKGRLSTALEKAVDSDMVEKLKEVLSNIIKEGTACVRQDVT